MILRITQKLAKKIKISPPPALAPHDDPFLDWTANLFMVSRWQCIILTNSRSLYSVVIPGKGVPNEKTLIEQGMKALRDSMTLDGIANIVDTKIAPYAHAVTLCKASNRSVLASMNQLVYLAKCGLMEMGLPLPLMNQRLNRTPMLRLDYRFPIEEFVELSR